MLSCALSFLGLIALDRQFAGALPQIGSTALATGSAVPGPLGPGRDADGADGEVDTAVGSVIGESAAFGGLTTERFRPDPSVWVDAASSGRPWSALGATEGLLTFRGNPTRTFHGAGPMPAQPSVQWTFAIGCSNSSVAGVAKQWCGSGWTGQPVVFPAPAGRPADSPDWWVGFGAYNQRINLLDPATGDEVLPSYRTGDIVKGTVTVDPDGFPLLYTGSRDDFYHVVALDRDEPEALWRLSAEAVQPTLWNNDWDGSGLVIDDYLFIGGENGRFFVVKLNRDYDADGLVTVDPEITFSTESWDSELLDAVNDTQVSVENSVAISGDVVYFTNSAGLVQGWDISGLPEGDDPERVFRYWSGDDTDATIVIDDEGMLYLGAEYERGNQRSRDLGQIIKLDPSNPDDPLVWSREANEGLGSGIWATPALWGELLIVATDGGQVLGLDRATGEEQWVLELEGPLWSSPVVVDDVLIQADCGGRLNAFDLVDGRPRARWSVDLGGCIESTPAVWNGWIYVGSRNGTFYALSD
ncbi:MAG: PQQ-binding-like beta-propeller repeat protein [Actinomycetota bacterium]